MAIAIIKIPNTLRKVEESCGDIFRDNQSVDLRMKNMRIKLMVIPAIMVEVLYSTFNEIIVVSVPAPANIGKAIGTILPEPPSS